MNALIKKSQSLFFFQIQITLLTFIIFFLPFAPHLSAEVGDNVALVKVIVGKAFEVKNNQKKTLKKGDWLKKGSLVKTSKKSFVKLVFVDKSQMNIGPESVMKIDSYDQKEAGVIDLVKGKIRSKVTTDYLQIQDKDKSKLFIKTNNAIMGVRGTDFLISSNSKSTSTILFEGKIAFNFFDKSDSSRTNLDRIVEQGVMLSPGEFSVVQSGKDRPTVPSLLNVKQLEKLQNSHDFQPQNQKSKDDKRLRKNQSKSIVPKGLTSKTISNNSPAIETEITKAKNKNTVFSNPSQTKKNQIDKKEKEVLSSKSEAEGFIRGQDVKPTNGSFVDIESGVIIPPGNDAIYDPLSNTYIPSPTAGEVDQSGNYIPPENVKITNDGKVYLTEKNSEGIETVTEVAAPTPVINENDIKIENTSEKSHPFNKEETSRGSSSDNSSGNQISNPRERDKDARAKDSLIDSRFRPSGGINSVNDPARPNIPKTERIIIIKE